MTTSNKLPIYFKFSIIIISFCALLFLLNVGKIVIVPLIYALILSLLLNPVVILFERKMPRMVAISLTVSLAVVISFVIVYFIGSQIVRFSTSLPDFENRIFALEQSCLNSLATVTGISSDELISKMRAEVADNGSAVIGKTVFIATGLINAFILITVYTFMMIYYQPLFIEFIRRLFAKEKHELVGLVFLSIRQMMQNYLFGLLVQVVIVSVLNAAGLFAIGIDYSLLIGLIGGFMSIVPYIGGFVSAFIPVIIAIATKDSSGVVWVIVLYAVVQFINNHYILPVVVGSKLKLNALISLIALVVFGLLWGIPGMVISIPITAIIKILFDQIESLKAWGYLLGDDMPSIKLVNLFFRKNDKKKLIEVSVPVKSKL